MVHGYESPDWPQQDPAAWQHVVSDYDPLRAAPPSASHGDLYSVPRRFDLSSMLVATTAYALLFTCMTVLNFRFWTFVYFAVMLAFVAVAQSVWADRYHPRRVSQLAGVAYQLSVIAILIALQRFFPQVQLSGERSFDRQMLLSMMCVVLLVSPILGYLSGVLVAGTFLVADALRGLLGVVHLHRQQEADRAAINSPWDEPV